MNVEKIKRLQKECKISEKKLIEIGLIPEKKSLIQGNVTKEEKKILRSYVNKYNLENENQTDVSKEIREVIDLILSNKSLSILDKYIGVVQQGNMMLDAKVPLLLEEDKLESLKKLCRVNKINISNFIRCCVIFYISNTERE